MRLTTGLLLPLPGNEWLHWGHPPCGAKRHMDLMCTSRISVQVVGRKTWWLYPVTEAVGNWTEVCANFSCLSTRDCYISVPPSPHHLPMHHLPTTSQHLPPLPTTPHHSPPSPPPASLSPTQVLHPLQVTLQPGDALVWFPGWEHETRIVSGPSISLSLHFTSPSNSSYQNTFSDKLSERVSPHCKWRDTSRSYT